jgi:hypothetical protein
VLSCIPNPVQLDETLYGQEKAIKDLEQTNNCTPSQ